MNVLIACEFSGVVRRAFRDAGHNAWSCDLLPSEDDSPFHYEGDVRDVLTDYWDLMVAHPPCTYLSVSGIHWNGRIPGRAEKTEEALDFIRLLLEAPIPRIALENPVSIISSRIRKPDQTIQPYEFGHDASKRTCLWLKGLPPLRPTAYVAPRMVCGCGHSFAEELGKYGCPDCAGDDGPGRPRWANQTDSGQNRLGPSEDRWKIRSETYEGIAEAMAQQWGEAA